MKRKNLYIFIFISVPLYIASVVIHEWGGGDDPCTAARKNHAPFFVSSVLLWWWRRRQQTTRDREMRTDFHKDCVLSFSVGTNITEIYDILCGCHLSKNNYLLRHTIERLVGGVFRASAVRGAVVWQRVIFAHNSNHVGCSSEKKSITRKKRKNKKE